MVAVKNVRSGRLEGHQLEGATGLHLLFLADTIPVVFSEEVGILT